MNSALIILITCLLPLQVSCLCNSTECPNTHCYQEKSNNDKFRVTTINTGDYNIQALGTFTEGTCKNVTRNGVAQYFALKYGLEKINNNTEFTRFGKIGLQVDNICRDLPMTMARGIEIISLHRPNSVCRSDFLLCKHETITTRGREQALAVVGTGMSFTTIPLASLMSLYTIPQVSYSASSRLLSKSNLYKSFFRTIPSDSNQVTVMIDLFKKFRWNYIIAIGSDDDYGKLGITDLKKDLTHVSDICITRDEYVPYNSRYTERRVDDVITMIERENRAKVVILFVFVKGLGDLILKRAQERNVTRIWITSEAWNPSALSLPAGLSNQAHGILTVSLKSNKLNKFEEYLMSALKVQPQCNYWLSLYIKEAFDCQPTGFDETLQKYIGQNCSVDYEAVARYFRGLTGRYENIIDAVTAIGHAIGEVAKKECSRDGSCPKLKSSSITSSMYKVKFTNDQEKIVEFDDNGDIKYAEYTIDNLRFENGKYKYVQVGTWSSRKAKGQQLTLNINQIQWPDWFQQKHPHDFPSSNCTDQCEPGKYMVTRQGCCWHCTQCDVGFYTDVYGQPYCTRCPDFYHSNKDNTGCLETKHNWMKITDSAGMIIIILSGIGFLIGLVCDVIILRYWKLAIIGDKYPHITFISLILILMMFAYGTVHMFKPSTLTCRIQNQVFFLNLVILTCALMLRSKFVTKIIQQYADEYFWGNLRLTQYIAFFGTVIAEIISGFVWTFYDDLSTEKELIDGEIRLMCQVKFSAARLVATFLPCVCLIIGTSCAFRERNLEHYFYERKFLNFCCIAECIVMLAFLPTFKYVSNVYRSIVLAYTHIVYAFTFMTCMILPRVYVALVREMKGMNAFPLKPATVKRKKQKKKKNELGETIDEEEEEGQPQPTPSGEATESSVVDTVAVANSDIANGDIPNSDNDEKEGVKKFDNDDDNREIHFSDGMKNNSGDMEKAPSAIDHTNITFDTPEHEKINGCHVNGGIQSDNEDNQTDVKVLPNKANEEYNTNL